MVETAKIIQAVCYILGRIGKANKLKLVKLLYLADKCHLVRYGRTITGDDYWAMDYGPVGSTAKDILGFDEAFLSREFEYASRMLRKVNQHEFEALATCDEGALDALSETDIEALQMILKNFGRMTSNELISYTHRYPEWAQYEKLFTAKQIKREKIDTGELLSTLPGDPFEVPLDHIEESKRILTGISE